MSVQNVTIIKLGGSIITDKTKPYTPLPDNIRQLAKEIKTIKMPLIVVHGSGSFGHTSAKLYGGSKGYKSTTGIAKVSYDAMHFNQIVMDVFLKENLAVISLHPRSLIFTQNGKLQQHSFAIVTHLLSQQLIPILYGDVLWDSAWKSTIFSGEKIILELANFLKQQDIAVTKVIFAGNTDGVYSKEGKTIPRLTMSSWRPNSQQHFTPVTNDVTGGMQHKMQIALQLASQSVPVWIINGARKNELSKAMRNIPTQGTVITS